MIWARIRGSQNFVMCDAISFGAASSPASDRKNAPISFAIVTRCWMFMRLPVAQSGECEPVASRASSSCSSLRLR